MRVDTLGTARVDSTILALLAEWALPPWLFHVHLSGNPPLNQKDGGCGEQDNKTYRDGTVADVAVYGFYKE